MATPNTEQQQHQTLLAETERLYEQYGKPLDQEHQGRLVAIAPDGRTLLGTSAGEVGRRAKAAFGPGFVFKL